MRPRIYVGWERVATAAPAPRLSVADLFVERDDLQEAGAPEQAPRNEQDPADLDVLVLDAVAHRTRCLVRDVAEDCRVERGEAEAALERLLAVGAVVMEGSRYEVSEQVIAERLALLLGMIGVPQERLRPAWRFQWEAATDPERPAVFSVQIRRVRRERVHYFQVLRSGQPDQAYDNLTDAMYDIIYADFESAVLAVFRGPFGAV